MSQSTGPAYAVKVLSGFSVRSVDKKGLGFQVQKLSTENTEVTEKAKTK